MRLGLIKKNDNNPNQEPIEGYNGQEDSHAQLVQLVPKCSCGLGGLCYENKKILTPGTKGRSITCAPHYICTTLSRGCASSYSEPEALVS